MVCSNCKYDAVDAVGATRNADDRDPALHKLPGVRGDQAAAWENDSLKQQGVLGLQASMTVKRW